jgi:pantothenate kinase-related protein Tda10
MMRLTSVTTTQKSMLIARSPPLSHDLRLLSQPLEQFARPSCSPGISQRLHYAKRAFNSASSNPEYISDQAAFVAPV